MPIWKITAEGPARVVETKLKQEKILEENLEDWIIKDSSILGENLLIIGRQVMIPEVGDRLDILALDPQGNAVVVELKRGKLKDPVDMQALRYASYISKWRFEDFENQARIYFDKVNDPEFNFINEFEQFCDNAGIDEIPDINSDQRLIIVGSEVKDKLGSVALWLSDHKIDIKIIEIEVYREGEAIFLQPHTIIPLPVSRFIDIGIGPRVDGSKPWITDGKTWHLDKRCSPKTRDMLLKLDDLIRDNFEVDGPIWNQKIYVAYRVGNYNWIIVNTGPSVLVLKFNVKAGVLNQSALAKHLNIKEFDTESSLEEKIGLPSSIRVINKNDLTDRIILRIKEDFDLKSEPFSCFLKDVYKERQ